ADARAANHSNRAAELLKATVGELFLNRRTACFYGASDGTVMACAYPKAMGPRAMLETVTIPRVLYHSFACRDQPAFCDDHPMALLIGNSDGQMQSRQSSSNGLPLWPFPSSIAKWPN